MNVVPIRDPGEKPAERPAYVDLYAVSRDMLAHYVRTGAITPHEAAQELERRRLASSLVSEGDD